MQPIKRQHKNNSDNCDFEEMTVWNKLDLPEQRNEF